MIFKDNYFFLSTFYLSPITLIIDGKECKFTNVEAAYQAQKNPQIADKFSQIKGLEAKRIGESLRITRTDWDTYYPYAMANALHSKFNNRLLLTYLKMINDEEIINDNYWGDKFWGVYKGEGKNILGKMLTNIRDNNNSLEALIDYIKNDLIKII